MTPEESAARLAEIRRKAADDVYVGTPDALFILSELDRVTAERDAAAYAAYAANADAAAYYAAYAASANAALAQVKQLREALFAVERGSCDGCSSPGAYCVICKAPNEKWSDEADDLVPFGHEPGCIVGSALAATEPKP